MRRRSLGTRGVGIGAGHYRRVTRLPARSARSALSALLLLLCPARAFADEGDILVQAGHQGRPQSCAPHHVKACNVGTAGGGEYERDWTAAVADRTTRVLREHGYTVVRRPADYEPHDTVRAAVFLHFDG